jgi:hypothetical protein
MDMPQPGQMAPAMPGGEEEAAEPAGTEICLAIAPDGSLSVYMEGGQGGEEQRQPVADIGAALQAMLDLYKQAEAGRERSADGGQEFDQGFQGNQQSMRGRMPGR